MNLNDIDPGGRPVHLFSGGGQLISSALVNSAQAITWSQGGDVNKLDAEFSIEAWQALGGQPANSLAALRLLEAQLEELRSNPNMQPIYLQPFQTNQSSPVYPARADPHDGWYWLEALTYDPESHNGRGAVEAKATFTRVTGPLPSSLRILYLGSAPSSTYSSTPVNLVALPVGATGPPFSMSRTGGEGAVPTIIVPSTASSRVPVVPSSTIANLWLGGVRCYDTQTPGSNAVPTGGTFTHATWVQIYGSNHALTGDLVITNGLWLVRLNQGGTVDLWCWQTQGSSAWVQVGTLAYRDSGLTSGTVRSIGLGAVGLRSSQATFSMNTSGGNFADFIVSLDAGQYAPEFYWGPQTEANSVGRGLALLMTTAVKVIANESAARDVATEGAGNVLQSTGAGWAVGIGTTANQLLVGLLWANSPNSGQPLAQATGEMGFGETSGPAQGEFRRYGVFAVPFSTTPANLLGEAESGTPGTGWTTVADGAASGGNVERCANANPSGNANTWGTAWQPPAGKYRMRVRLKLGSLASSTSQMKIGLWNSTDSVYVASTTYAPNAAALAGGTSFIWVDVTGLVTPTAGKNMRFRAETTATTTTNWDFDQAVLVPDQSSTLGQGNFPGDIWVQWMGRRRLQMVPG